MMNECLRATVFALLCGLPCAGIAATERPVSQLFECIFPMSLGGVAGAYDAGLKLYGQAKNDAEPHLNEASQCLDAAFRPALDASEGHDDLIAAIKAYVIAMRLNISQLRNTSPTSPEAYRQRNHESYERFMAARETLKLELELSGLEQGEPSKSAGTDDE